jgi:hypothetical protein
VVANRDLAELIPQCRMVKGRHVRRRHDRVRQLISTGIITVDCVKSKDNIADPLTKRPKWRVSSEVVNGNGTEAREKLSS